MVILSHGRIVIVASGVHEFLPKIDENSFDFKSTFSPTKSKSILGILTQYSYSKLFTTYLCRSLFLKYSQKGLNIACLHPGAIHTNIQREAGSFLAYLVEPFMYLFFKTPFQGAQNTL